MDDAQHDRTQQRVLIVFTVLGSALLLALVALFAYAPIFAVDFFWQLKLGEIIATTGAIPDRDLFSAVHPERPYVQFQWLWELCAYAAQRAGGLHGVRVMQVAWMTSSFALLGWLSWRAFGSRALAFSFCALGLVLFEDRFQTRPSATALGFVACMLPLWLGTAQVSLRVALSWSFAVTCLWSNLHGGESLLSILCLGALAVGAWIERRSGVPHAQGRQRRAWLLLLAACAGVLCSPTFAKGLGDWTWAIQPQLASGNKEWRPTYTMLENGLTPSFLLIAAAPTLLLVLYVWEQVRLQRSAPGTRPVAEWLLCGGLFVLSQQAVRNAFLCLVPLAFMLRRAAPRMTPPRTRVLTSAVGVCLLLIAFDDHVLQGYGGVEEARELIGHDLAPATFPEQLSQFLEEVRIEGGIFNDGRWGGYLIWRRWPQNHVFVDSRHDLSSEMWPIFLAAQAPGERYAAMEQAYQRWGIALAAFRGPTFPAVRAPATWQLLYKAGEQELYQRLGAANAERNLTRAQVWLSARAHDRNAALSQLAVEVGARRWLDAPYQRFRMAQAETLLRSASAEDAARGLERKAQLWFDAGMYQAALGALEVLLAHAPQNTKATYQALLCALAIEDPTRTRRWLSTLARRKHELSSLQLSRLRAIDRANFL